MFGIEIGIDTRTLAIKEGGAIFSAVVSGDLAISEFALDFQLQACATKL